MKQWMLFLLFQLLLPRATRPQPADRPPLLLPFLPVLPWLRYDDPEHR
jgi:hypothetical protein